jgi:peptidoglycan/LPS O-acetylase OafA/YrhL
MLKSERRYDIDAVRVIAIGLLLIYHVAIGFQSWGIMIGFITNKNSWTSLWMPMAMLNVWRIPLLFFVSGMGVYFAIQNRSLKELILERASRILLPFIVGMFLIVPVHTYLWQQHYNFALDYNPSPGHLWFLGNIFVYVVVLSPIFFYLKKNDEGIAVKTMKRMFKTPLGLLPVFAALILEVLIVDPRPFEMYAMTWHGFFLGLLAFFFGFCFVLSGRVFWEMLLKWRWMFLSVAAAMFAVRITQFQFAPGYLLSIESVLWILSVFAFGYRYLNRPGKWLTYLSQAAYPIYILHMMFLYLGSLVIFPLQIPVSLQFVLVLLFTTIGCFTFYELIIRRINIIRPLFGLKMKEGAKPVPVNQVVI